MIRFRLSELDDYLHEIDNDIIKFNRHVKVLVYNLHARGETTIDLLANLFKAYAACSDQTFVRYVADLQTKWEDNEDLTAKELCLRRRLSSGFLSPRAYGRPRLSRRKSF